MDLQETSCLDHQSSRLDVLRLEFLPDPVAWIGGPVDWILTVIGS